MKYLLTSLFILLLIGIFAYARADSQGANSPGTMADDATVGTVAWGFVNNAKTLNGSRAIVGLTNQDSHYIKASNFGFAIPTSATVNGILVEFTKNENGAGQATDNAIRIVKSDGTFGSTNKAALGNWPTDDSYAPYGSSSDLWNETWTATDINNSNFGAGISAHGDSSGVNALIDHIRITVYYTTASGAPQQQIRSGQNVKSGQMIIK